MVELYDKLIDDMKRGGKLGNAGVYKYSRTSLLKFTGQRLQIPFSDIDAVWLRRYENWLRTSGCGDTTISQLFRTLRSVFNKAIELQLVKRDYHPQGDNPVQLRIVGEMLERSGVSCRTCINAKEVVSAMRMEKYDLILADIQMRGTSGFDLLRLLRHSNIGDSRTIPVAAMTARSDGDGNRYAEAGFSGCIRKPFSMHELLHFISSILSSVPEQEERNADFDAMISETTDRDRLLEAFIEESNHNKADLQEALQHIDMDIERMKETLHRMYPVWEQLSIANELEEYSAVLHDDEANKADIRRHTEAVIDRLHGLAAEAGRMLGRR